MTFLPAHSVLQASGHVPTHTAFILHGILGHQRNWRSFARAFTQAHPHWRLVLIDLRNHGESQGAPAPHTVENTAHDLLTLSLTLGTPQAVIGHSFGGKVALAFSKMTSIPQTWVLDAMPGVQDDSARRELTAIFNALRTAGAPFASRETMMDALGRKGLAPALIQWMTTNLRRKDNGFHWSFQLENATDMIQDYFDLDTLPILTEARTSIHIVRAAENHKWTQESLEELANINPVIRVNTLENAGHWLHIDNPSGLLNLMAPYFAL